ncbi:hypothetical protein ACU4GD_28240 [Cupriavidus basilensis]
MKTETRYSSRLWAIFIRPPRAGFFYYGTHMPEEGNHISREAFEALVGRRVSALEVQRLVEEIEEDWPM